MIKSDYATPLPRELDRPREERAIAYMGLYMLAVLVAALFWFGG